MKSIGFVGSIYEYFIGRGYCAGVLYASNFNFFNGIFKFCIVMYGIAIPVHIFSQHPPLKSFKYPTISPHDLLTFINQVIMWNSMTKN